MLTDMIFERPSPKAKEKTEIKQAIEKPNPSLKKKVVRRTSKKLTKTSKNSKNSTKTNSVQEEKLKSLSQDSPKIRKGNLKKSTFLVKKLEDDAIKSKYSSFFNNVRNTKRSSTKKKTQFIDQKRKLNKNQLRSLMRAYMMTLLYPFYLKNDLMEKAYEKKQQAEILKKNFSLVREV